MSEKEFNDWWNGDHLPPNPYPKDSPIFWAWAGWQMGVKAERDRAVRICRETMQNYEARTDLNSDMCRIGFLSAEVCMILIKVGEKSDDSPTG